MTRHGLKTPRGFHNAHSNHVLAFPKTAEYAASIHRRRPSLWRRILNLWRRA